MGGFGGKYGVQTDRKDKAAHGWDTHEKLAQHASQTDASKGFGGKFGVHTQNMDQNAGTFEDMTGASTTYKRTTPVAGGTTNIRSKFENMAVSNQEEQRKRTEEERIRRQKREEELQRVEEERQLKRIQEEEQLREATLAAKAEKEQNELLQQEENERQAELQREQEERERYE